MKKLILLLAVVFIVFSAFITARPSVQTVLVLEGGPTDVGVIKLTK